MSGEGEPESRSSLCRPWRLRVWIGRWLEVFTVVVDQQRGIGSFGSQYGLTARVVAQVDRTYCAQQAGRRLVNGFSRSQWQTR